MTREEIYSRFEELDKRASLGGGVDKIEKQHAQGKMTARERIGMLLDKGTFNELDKLVNHRCTNFGMEKKQPNTVRNPDKFILQKMVLPITS